MSQIEHELKALIIDRLMLHDLSVEHMDSHDHLVSDYGLDSIDMLELAMVIKKQYGVEFADGDEKNEEYFQSIHTLAEHITANRADDDPIESPYDGRKSELYQGIVQGISELFEFPVEILSPETHLVDDLDLDSLDALDLVVRLQDEFGARVPEEDLMKLRTIDDVVEITARLSESHESTRA